MSDETTTLVIFHEGRLRKAFDEYIAEQGVDPEAVEINQLDYEGGSQWWARSKRNGEYDVPVLLYEVTFDNPMEAN